MEGFRSKDRTVLGAHQMQIGTTANLDAISATIERTALETLSPQLDTITPITELLAFGHEGRGKGTKSAPRKRSNPGCVGNDRSRKRYVERFRATEWIAPSEFRNWLELPAILRIRWAVPVTVRNGPEGDALETAAIFVSYLSLPFPDGKTVVFPHRAATLAG